MRKKIEMLTNAARICSVPPLRNWKTMLSMCPKKIQVSTVCCPAVSATEVIASTPTANAKPSETIWLRMYERFLATPQT
jgi:hypothetical protein